MPYYSYEDVEVLSSQHDDWLTELLFFTSSISKALEKCLGSFIYTYPDLQAKLFLAKPVSARAKERPSIIRKYIRRNIENRIPDGASFEDVISGFSDLVGIRFVCMRCKQGKLVEDDIRLMESCGLYPWARFGDVELKGAPAPYRARHLPLHVNIKRFFESAYAVSVMPPPDPFPDALQCEIQIQSLIQSTYHSINHRYCYKPIDRPSPYLIARRELDLTRCADCFHAWDEYIDETLMFPDSKL